MKNLNSVKIKPDKPRARARSAPRASKAKRVPRPYHHGDLRAALIEATETIILERGVDGFSLREAARRAGVSPAAPAHHFGDAAGLLSEVAALGFKEFGDLLRSADQAGGSDPSQRLYRQGIAYVTFALENPARFRLMFRSDVLNPAHKGLLGVARDSFQTLENAIRALVELPGNQQMTPAAYGALMAVWSVVHGFSHLALGGEFERAAHAYGGRSAILERFLPLTLGYLLKRAGEPRASRTERRRLSIGHSKSEGPG